MGFRWLLLALAVFLGAAFPYFENFTSMNERPRLLQGIAWVEAGEFAIDGDAARGIKPGIDVARGVDGRVYPNKPPGATVPAAVAYGALRAADPVPEMRSYTWVARMLGGWLPTLLLCAFAWRRLEPRFGAAAASFAVVAYALATPVTSYGRLLFGHQLAACLLFVGIAWVVDGRDPRRAALGGVLAGSAVAVEYFAAFAGVPVAILLAWRLRDPAMRQGALAAIGGALVPIVLLGAYQASVFGSVFATPYHHVISDDFAATHATGLLGLSVPTATSIFEHAFSPWGGLVLWAPLTLVGAVALFFGRCTVHDRVCFATFVLVVVLSLGLTQTGGWRVGPRYAVAVLPFALPGLAMLWRQMKVRPVYIATVAMGTFSVLANALASTFFPHLFPEGNPLWDLLVPLLTAGREPHGLFAGLGLSGVALVLGPTALFAWTVRHRKRELAVALLLGLALFGATASFESTNASEQTAAAVFRIWEPR